MDKPKILFIASEAAPFIKSGGLGDVAGSLPKALSELGADIRVVLPKYRGIAPQTLDGLQHLTSLEVHLDWRKPIAEIYSVPAAVPTYLVGNDHYFYRDNIYGYGDDFQRFAFFTKAALQMLPALDFQPDIVHFHDWQTGLGSVYLKDIFKKFTFYKNMKCIFTIHNLQYQGTFAPDVLPQVDLNYGYFVPDKLEFFGAANYMKAGLTYSDFITTVSPTYAHEIQTPEYGYGMQGLLAARNHQLLGILNGIDYDEYSPSTQPSLFTNYNEKDIAGKLINKTRVQEICGLPINPDVPVFAIISRIVEQKGFDIISAAMDEMMHHKDMQIIILGTGHHHFEHMLSRTAHYHPHKLSVNLRFDAALAHQIYAASDFFLMPSLFEPCGLGQLMALRYGSLPVARKTGGLVDTVVPYNYDTKKGHGILFENYDAGGLLWGVNEALSLYQNKQHYRKAQKNAMKADFSWENSAKQYIELYESIID
ncbi:MAG: glycogen synthase GlgA [Defluviitaleaceae bacterium]|nr:glycogen synthase GlgA [Defluviitaleaceae bacterium]